MDEPVVAVPDDITHQFPVCFGAHGQGVFEGAGGLQEGGRYELAHSQFPREFEISGQVIGDGDAANDDGADRRDPFGDLDGHHSAEGESDEDKGLGEIYLSGEAEGVVGEAFLVLWIGPVDIGSGESFG